MDDMAVLRHTRTGHGGNHIFGEFSGELFVSLESCLAGVSALPLWFCG